MEFLPKQPTVKAPAKTFTGDAWYDVIVRENRRPASASTSSASRPEPGTPGTRTRSARPFT